MTVDDVITAFGGQTALGDLLGVSSQAVWNMKARGAVPSRHWARLVSAGEEKGKPEITFEALAAIVPETCVAAARRHGAAA